MSRSIYFIALMPDETLCEEVRQFKLHASRNFGSSHALKSPAHITLFPPFSWDDAEIVNIELSLLEIARQQKSFEVQLSDFDHFDDRVIFVNVMGNEALFSLYDLVKKTLFRSFDFPDVRGANRFHPHMTVAFKDLKKSIFTEAWHYYSQLDFERDFEADSLNLLRHDGQQWQIFREFNFKPG